MEKISEFLRTHPTVFPLGLIFIIFILLIYLVGSGLVTRQVRFLSRGAGIESVDPTTSLIFANPLSVSNSKTPVSIKVQLRDKDSVAVSGVDVTLNAVEGSIAAASGGNLQATTSGDGIAEFKIVLPELKQTRIQALYGPSKTPISNTVLIQIVTF